MSQHVTIRIGEADATEPLFPEWHDTVECEPLVVGILEKGTESGDASLWVGIEAPGGAKYGFQMTAGMWESISGALKGAKARWAGE